MVTMFVALAALAMVAQDAPAQDGAGQEPPTRIRSVLLYGDEQCPTARDDDEIVGCSSAGDSPFRIPEALRERPERPANVSWVRRVEVIEEVNRVGLPDSCSPVGTGGQTGCTRQMLQQWAQERLERQRREGQLP